MLKTNIKFAQQVKTGTQFNAAACINCGSCTALCPLGIDLHPRTLFRYVLIGAEDKLMENTANIFSCLLCKMCEDNCPADVPIAENIRSLRSYINHNKFGLIKG
jgi:heterodisulfide reductase subunit C2